MRIIGIVLICIGLLTLALPYITFTEQEKVIDIGPLEAVAEKKERIPVSPIIGDRGPAILLSNARVHSSLSQRITRERWIARPAERSPTRTSSAGPQLVELARLF